MKNTQTQDSPKYFWLWNASSDPFDKKIQPEWKPYSDKVNKLFEENLLKNAFIFEIDINGIIYYVDLIHKVQYLKNEPFRCRPIYRAKRKDTFLTIKINEADYLVEKSTNEQISKGYQEEKEIDLLQVKVCELFGDPKIDRGFIFEDSNTLFNSEIRIPCKMHEILKNKFYKKVNFNNFGEVIVHLKEEITKEAYKYLLLNKGSKKFEIPDQMYYANPYIEKLSQNNLILEDVLVSFCSIEGFLINHLNRILMESTTFETNLNLYFTLLQASILIVSKKYNSKYAHKSVQNIEGESFYVFYGSSKFLKKELLKEIESSKQECQKTTILNLFLGTTLDYEKGPQFLPRGNIEDDQLAPVFYKIQINKNVVDINPNLFCILGQICENSEEKQVVILSAFCVIEVKSVNKHISGNFYEATLELKINNQGKKLC